jgi:hypothetical protein
MYERILDVFLTAGPAYCRSGREIEMHGIIVRVEGRAFATGRTAVLCMVLAGTSFGCAATPRSPFVDPEDARIHIEVLNRNFLDATLHAIWPGGRRRLGTVIGITTAEYRLPWTFSEILQIEIDLLAGPGCITRGILANPGDIILVEIDPQFRYCGL